MQNIFLLHKSQMLTVPIDTTSKTAKDENLARLLYCFYFYFTHLYPVQLLPSPHAAATFNNCICLLKRCGQLVAIQRDELLLLENSYKVLTSH